MLRIKELRKSRGLTAKQFAEAIKVAESTVSFYENGKREPDYDTLKRIADFFDVTIDYLLGREDEPEQTKKPAEGELSELSKNKKEILNLLDQVDPQKRDVVDLAVKALIQSIIDSQ